MPEEIASNEKVIITAVTFERITYPKFTPVKDLPDELQKKVKERKFVEAYGKIHKPEEKNIDYKKNAELAERKVTSLTETIQQLNKKVAALEKAAKKPEKPKPPKK